MVGHLENAQKYVFHPYTVCFSLLKSGPNPTKLLKIANNLT